MRLLNISSCEHVFRDYKNIQYFDFLTWKKENVRCRLGFWPCATPWFIASSEGYMRLAESSMAEDSPISLTQTDTPFPGLHIFLQCYITGILRRT